MPEVEFQRAHSYDDALARAAGECGIESQYWDIFHKRHEISLDVRWRILQALGWDVSSEEQIEQRRRKQFQERWTTTLPQTLVISESDRTAPLTLPAPIPPSIQFEIALENGETEEGNAQLSEVRRIRETAVDDHRWITFELRLPETVPLGYHTIAVSWSGGRSAQSNLIVCPERAYSVENLRKNGRTAGFNVALYGLRSERNWGCGDFTDLRRLCKWANQAAGFSFIGVNPLHAIHNRVPYNTSPYLPLSIFYKNPIYLDIESIPEFQQSKHAQQLFHSAEVQQQIARLRASEFVEYEEIDALKRQFLSIVFREFLRRRAENPERSKAFTAYCEREGDLLHKFALYCALDETLHKEDRNRWTWLQWPAEYQDPDSPACRAFAKQQARCLEAYKYIQFVIEEQLSAAQQHARECGLAIGLYHDLALATDSRGSDLWAHRRFYVSGCRVGAPPDDFSPNGQDWAFPPPNTMAHREDGYAVYRESIRKIMRHGGGLRIDHVMRLFRLFWIPEGSSAAEGTYMRDNAVDLLRILALESVRNQSVVIGEDLGTVTDEMRDTLARFGILSYRLFYFEKHEPDKSFKWSREYPAQALVSSTTHDLPTIAGFWSFRDIEARKAAGLADEHAYRAQMEDRKRERQRMLDTLHSEQLLPTYYPRDAEQVREVDGELHNAIIGFLAQTPSSILLLNQEDLTKETEQQNLPGSTVEYPNWRRKMKVTMEELAHSESIAPYIAMFRDQLTRTGRVTRD